MEKLLDTYLALSQIPYFSKFQKGSNNNALNQPANTMEEEESIEVEEEDQFITYPNAGDGNLTRQILNYNKNQRPRFIIPKHRQLVFNGVIYINLGDKTDMLEFYEQFMTSENFQVQKIEKKKQHFQFDIIRGFYKDQVDSQHKLDYARYLLEHSQNQNHYQILQTLNSLLNYSMQFQRHIEMVIAYYANNIEQLYQIKSERICQMQKLSLLINQSLFQVKDQHNYSENLMNIINNFDIFNSTNNIDEFNTTNGSIIYDKNLVSTNEQYQKLQKEGSIKLDLNFLHNNNRQYVNYLKDFNDSYLVTIHFSPAFEHKTQSISSYDVTFPFLNIIGTTEQEFLSITMRSGFQCWLTDDACEAFNVQIAKCLITQEDILDVVIPDQELMTVDGIVIVCDMRFICVQNMWNTTHPYLPVNLQPTLDYFIILKYEIKDKHLNALKKMRQSTDLSCAVAALSSSIPYQIQTEIFFDKFYKEEYEQMKKNSSLQQSLKQMQPQQEQYCEDTTEPNKMCGIVQL